MSGTGSIFFRVFDVNFPCVESAPVDSRGDKIELIDGGPDPELILLRWPSSDSPPDFIWSASTKLFVSSRVKLRWQLTPSESVTLVPVHLLASRGEFVATDYWWVNIHSEHRIMDRERSQFDGSGRVVLKIRRFVVDWELVPPLDLFICRDIYKPVFSERYVRAAREGGFSGVVFTPVDGGAWPA